MANRATKAMYPQGLRDVFLYLCVTLEALKNAKGQSSMITYKSGENSIRSSVGESQLGLPHATAIPCQ
ncbi:MAG: hypothetical protein ACTMIA_08085 [Vibrio sp.]